MHISTRLVGDSVVLQKWADSFLGEKAFIQANRSLNNIFSVISECGTDRQKSSRKPRPPEIFTPPTTADTSDGPEWRRRDIHMYMCARGEGGADDPNWKPN